MNVVDDKQICKNKKSSQEGGGKMSQTLRLDQINSLF